jgi:hypothetical protein
MRAVALFPQNRRLRDGCFDDMVLTLFSGPTFVGTCFGILVLFVVLFLFLGDLEGLSQVSSTPFFLVYGRALCFAR